MKNKYSFLIAFGFLAISLSALTQDEEFAELDAQMDAEPEKVSNTFESTRLINGHTIETLKKNVLEFRVEHRFGDIAGSLGGAQTNFGFDNVADIRLAFEYGLTDRLMIGLGRSKGNSNPFRNLVDGFVKWRFLDQKEGGSPVSIAGLATSSFSYMTASTDSSQISYFPKDAHRLAYCTQLNIARKFNDRLSLALMPTVIHQNYVDQDNQNTIFALGGGGKIGITKTVSVMFEYYQCMTSKSIRQYNFNSLSVGVQFITFGHDFTLFFTNASGLGETQFITNTISSWTKGQFRFGFAIGRKFEY